MRARLIVSAACGMMIVPLATASAGQSQGRPAAARGGDKASSTTGWTTPRTPWGDPDLQGRWPSFDMLGTPYERPKELAGRTTLNDEEFAARVAARQEQAEADAEQVVVQRPPRRGAGIGSPSHWGERGTPSRQASLVVEPADGRLPPLTQEGQQRIAFARSTYHLDFPDLVVAHPFDNFEDLGPHAEHPQRRARGRREAAAELT